MSEQGIDVSALLDRRPQEATRLLALELLAQADAARDGDALHDFRVALRRFRTLVRAFPRELKSGVPGGPLRRLKRIADATSAARDAEVSIEWIERARDALDEHDRVGADWLLARRRDERDRARGGIADDLSREFTRARRRLSRMLSRYEITYVVGAPETTTPFGDALAKVVRAHAAAFAGRVKRLAEADDARAIHRARIAAKRLRYLLEPAMAVVPDVHEAVQQLKRIQTSLGTIHDRDVLADVLRDAIEVLAREERHAEAGGIAALVRRCVRERADELDEASRGWLRDGASSFFTLVERAAAAIKRPPHDARHAPNAPMEIERKYLLTALPPIARMAPFIDIEQGWIPGERLMERLRRATRDGATRYYRTVKTGAGVARVELEEETSAGVFAALWPTTQARRIAKRRYLVPHGDVTWELDEVESHALVLAEIEMESTDEEVEIPDWLAPFIVRDVTDEPAYTNYALARDIPE